MKTQKYNLLKKFIDELPTPSMRTSYYDSKVRGLYLDVTITGLKSFYVRRWTGAKSEKLYIGRFPEVTVEQARTRATSFYADLSSGVNQAEVRRNEKSDLILGDLFELYLERHMRKSRKTPDATKANFYSWFAGWKNRKLHSIDREAIEAFHGQLAKERGKYVANRALELIRAVYNKAILWKIWNHDNPACGITEFSEHSRDRILREDEIDSFFRALEREPKDIFYDFIMLLILTGQRKSNVLGMRWHDVDMQAKKWSIPGELMKNGQSLTIALTEMEMSVLRRRLTGKVNEFVFPSVGKTGHYVEPKRRWKTLLAHASIQNLHFHDLRRTLASYMANSGANVALIQSALNHKDLKTTLHVYAKTARRAELEAREKAHDLMFSLVDSSQPAVTGSPSTLVVNSSL